VTYVKRVAFRRLATTVLAVLSIGLALSGALTMILRRRPPRAIAATRALFGRVLNPVLLTVSEWLGVDQSVVYHIGRRSGREYATPLCVVETSEGFIVPAAFGPDVDWLKNLRVTSRARLVHYGVEHEVEAEVIEREEAYRLAGGTAGCPCWDQFRIEAYALLRPTADDSSVAEPATAMAGIPGPAEG
jgi:deazaflavin-dependent oxidoreductase (nitroreductase family)